MDWKTITKLEAKNKTEELTEKGERAFRNFVSDLDTNAGKLNEDYRSLRKELVAAWFESEKEVSSFREDKSRKLYLTDLLFAEKMYLILQKRGMDVRIASNDRVWYYLNTYVVPDLVFRRYGESDFEKNHQFVLHADRIYKTSVRLFLKTSWWYLYLSMQFNDEGKEDLPGTVKMLWYHNTDTVVQFVERAGREGYRVKLYRTLMKYYSEHPEYSALDFRKAMVLNTARSQVIEPSLSRGEDKEYVKELFDYFRDSSAS